MANGLPTRSRREQEWGRPARLSASGREGCGDFTGEQASGKEFTTARSVPAGLVGPSIVCVIPPSQVRGTELPWESAARGLPHESGANRMSGFRST